MSGDLLRSLRARLGLVRNELCAKSDAAKFRCEETKKQCRLDLLDLHIGWPMNHSWCLQDPWHKSNRRILTEPKRSVQRLLGKVGPELHALQIMNKKELLTEHWLKMVFTPGLLISSTYKEILYIPVAQLLSVADGCSWLPTVRGLEETHDTGEVCVDRKGLRVTKECANFEVRWIIPDRSSPAYSMVCSNESDPHPVITSVGSSVYRWAVFGKLLSRVKSPNITPLLVV
ncbi:uncharacterized protein DEA37_0005264 [Paragonimus westermani]|uniref:Uncharacterized protein n=1 Tax=Paragonimus westermani TaxID=34504 RepID=A0A5J4N9H3_9TREM|nr:uncharacterized protein DEA37_0005264 [Paragonimus westermani]